MKRVLILCTGNSCRSQMAEALWNHLAGGAWQAFSAGSNPAGYVHPKAIAAIKELSLDISRNESKHVEQFVDRSFDLVVTVCGGAKESCPTIPGAQEMVHWPFDDPAYAEGTEEEKTACFRRVRDEIQDRINRYLIASQ